MASATLDDVHKGWKVFAGSEEIGEVVDVGTHDLEVRRGSLVRHVFRVPAEYIAEAADGVVDLNVDRETAEHGAAEPEMPSDMPPE